MCVEKGEAWRIAGAGEASLAASGPQPRARLFQHVFADLWIPRVRLEHALRHGDRVHQAVGLKVVEGQLVADGGVGAAGSGVTRLGVAIAVFLVALMEPQQQRVVDAY